MLNHGKPAVDGEHVDEGGPQYLALGEFAVFGPSMSESTFLSRER